MNTQCFQKVLPADKAAARYNKECPERWKPESDFVHPNGSRFHQDSHLRQEQTGHGTGGPTEGKFIKASGAQETGKLQNILQTVPFS